MPIIRPSTQLILLANVKLDNTYMNQLYFSNASSQANYFLTKRAYEPFDDFQYIRKNESVVVPINYEHLYFCDYVMYRNSNFGDRWVYAFITNKIYRSDKSTEITLEIDCYQTYMFDIKYFPSFITRSHQKEWNGTGLPSFDNLYPEGLEYGRDYVVSHTEVVGFNKFYALLCSAATLNAPFGSVNNPELFSSRGGIIDRLPTALDFYVVDNINGNTGARTNSLEEILEELSSHPWIAQQIQSITIVPQEIIGDNWNVVNLGGGSGTLKIGKLESGYESQNITLPEIKDFIYNFPEYQHQKLYAYPYSFIEMTCYNGTQLIIKPEAVNSDSLEINIVNYVGAQPRMSYFVQYYNDYGDNGVTYPDGSSAYGDFLDSSVTNGNFPQMPVMVDNYLLYMASNTNSMQFTNSLARYQQLEGIVGGAGKLLSGNIGGALSTAYSGIKNGEITIRQQAAKIQDAELNPPSLAGQSGGDAFNIANGITGITLKWKTIRPQYADRLEAYFERYGYIQNKIDYPVLTGMSVFNYLQTTEITLGGNIPDEDLNVIANMFNTGVTMWHNGDVGNYTENRWVGV